MEKISSPRKWPEWNQGLGQHPKGALPNVRTEPHSNRGFAVKYYSHCYYKLWQYYAKYAYHADKLSHSHSCLLERELPL